MNYDKLYSFIQNNLFTDLVLTLHDDTHQLIINVNKNILAASCIYFEKLFTNCKEKTLNNITVEVPNVYVTNDIIMSFYGQEINSGNLSDTRHLLESIKCNNFLGLYYDLSLLDDIEIPETDFELFLDIADLVGYDDNIIKLINKNLPKEYDLSKFPEELLDEMLDLAQAYMITSGSLDGDVKIWDPKSGYVETLCHHSLQLYYACYSYDHKLIATGAEQKIKIWDAETGECIKVLKSYNHVWCMAFSPDNTRIVSANNSSIILWDIETETIIHTLIKKPATTTCICYSPDNKYIASGNVKTEIKIWDAQTYELVDTLRGHNNTINVVCYSSDCKYLISASKDHTIKIWDAITRNLLYTLTEHTDSVYCLCFSPDDQYLASGSRDYQIKIWNFRTGELIKTLANGSDTIFSLCYSPDGKYIVSGDSGNNIKIWNLITNELVQTFNGHHDSIWNIYCITDLDNHKLIQRILKVKKIDNIFNQ
jgi:WD40 repeat protein